MDKYKYTLNTNRRTPTHKVKAKLDAELEDNLEVCTIIKLIIK